MDGIETEKLYAIQGAEPLPGKAVMINQRPLGLEVAERLPVQPAAIVRPHRVKQIENSVYITEKFKRNNTYYG